MLECGLSFGLEGNDDETHEDVDHKECYDDDVDKVENGNIWTVVMLRTNIRCIGVNGDVENPEILKLSQPVGLKAGPVLPRPPLECGHDEEGEHGPDDVVVVELVPGPVSLLHHRLTPDDSVLVDEVLALASLLLQLGPVRAHPELPLEELDPNDGEDEEEEDGDEDNVVDGLHSHDDALDHVLEALGSVDSSEDESFSFIIILSAVFCVFIYSYLKGLRTRRTRSILTTEMAPELKTNKVSLSN